MKKILFSLSAVLLFAVIVIPAVSPVNHSATYVSHGNSWLAADGNPIPPPIPPSATPLEVLLADGNPLPPPLPPGATGLGAFIV